MHRPRDWVLDNLPVPQPRRISTSFTLSPTYVDEQAQAALVEDNHVSGWDDRMPTIAGYRRRGFTASAIRNFCQGVGVTKYKGVTDVSLLENAIREELGNAERERCWIRWRW